MALRAVLFGTKKISEKFKPFYDEAIKRGDFKIVAQIEFDSKANRFLYSAGQKFTFDIAIISSHQDLYVQTKLLEAQGVPREKIIDGRVFTIPNLDFPRFLKEKVAYSVLEKMFSKPLTR